MAGSKLHEHVKQRPQSGHAPVTMDAGCNPLCQVRIWHCRGGDRRCSCTAHAKHVVRSGARPRYVCGFGQPGARSAGTQDGKALPILLHIGRVYKGNVERRVACCEAVDQSLRGTGRVGRPQDTQQRRQVERGNGMQNGLHARSGHGAMRNPKTRITCAGARLTLRAKDGRGDNEPTYVHVNM